MAGNHREAWVWPHAAPSWSSALLQLPGARLAPGVEMLPEMLDLAWVQILELKIAFFLAGIKRTLQNHETLVL